MIVKETLSDRLCDGAGDFTAYTFTYASATTMTIPGDWTSIFVKGSKVELYQTEQRYGYITATSTYSAPNTTITIAYLNDAAGNIHAIDNAVISNVYIGNSCTLRNHPLWINWTSSYSAVAPMTFTSVSTTTARFYCYGPSCYIEMWANGTTGGTATTVVRFTAPIVYKTGASINAISAILVDNGVVDPGFWQSTAGSTNVDVYHVPQHNWALGAGRQFVCTGWYII
jgi:hypothetical protein